MNNQTITVTGFSPNAWEWANGELATVSIDQTGTYTLTLGMREDGLRVAKRRLFLTTDTTTIPTGFGLVESQRQTTTLALGTLARTIDYDYDDLYRLTQADYTTGENYQYSYDPVGNRLQQIINGIDDFGLTIDDWFGSNLKSKTVNRQFWPVFPLQP